MLFFNYRLKNDLAEIGLMAKSLESINPQGQLDKKNLFQINLVLDELCTNIITYAYGDIKEHQIDIRIELDGNKIIITIEDEGKPFDPTQEAEYDFEQPLEDRPIGGLGIHLVRQYTNDISYTRVNDKNVLVLIKSLRV